MKIVKALGRSLLLMLAFASPILGLAISTQNGTLGVTVGNIRNAAANCEGPPPNPDWDSCGNPPTATPTPTPIDH
jgi:hypothetical protein